MGYCTEVQYIITRCSCIIAGINARYADGTTAFRFKTPAQRPEVVKLDVSKKHPKLIGRVSYIRISLCYFCFR